MTGGRMVVEDSSAAAVSVMLYGPSPGCGVFTFAVTSAEVSTATNVD
jgi:hypothetical protein